MSDQPPSSWPLTPLAGFGGTLVGVLVLYYGQAFAVPPLIGGAAAVCDTPDCALGLGLLLMVGGFFTLCAAMIAGLVVGVRNRKDTGKWAATRRGLLVSAWCSAAYLVYSVIVWWPK